MKCSYASAHVVNSCLLMFVYIHMSWLPRVSHTVALCVWDLHTNIAYVVCIPTCRRYMCQYLHCFIFGARRFFVCFGIQNQNIIFLNKKSTASQHQTNKKKQTKRKKRKKWCVFYMIYKETHHLRRSRHVCRPTLANTLVCLRGSLLVVPAQWGDQQKDRCEIFFVFFFQQKNFINFLEKKYFIFFSKQFQLKTTYLFSNSDCSS